MREAGGAGPFPRRRFGGRVALVVGAGSAGAGWSDGRAGTVSFAREGAVVVALDRMGDPFGVAAAASALGARWPVEDAR